MAIKTFFKHKKRIKENIVKNKLTIKTFILGLQHVFAMFGACVLVPLLTGLDPSVALFGAGVGTLIFHYITKKKVPVFLGSSFAFIAAIQVVGKQYGLQYAQGGIIIAGLMYVLFALVVLDVECIMFGI